MSSARPGWARNGGDVLSQSWREVGLPVRRNAAARPVVHHDGEASARVQHEPLAINEPHCSR
jgi:hypothetical protein